jgi:CubicO group peptidase (beta-lactamase class C family)
MRVWISTIALCLLWCSASASCAAPQKKVGSIRRLDGTTISVTEAEEFARTTLRNAHVTGAQIVVVDQARLVWSATFGLRRREPGLPMDHETTMWAASITKSVFSTYVMQLVERGEFQLDVPMAKQLAKPLDQYDDYREKAVELVRDPAWAVGTPRMLLSHSSGLKNFATIEPDKKLHLHSSQGRSSFIRGRGSTWCSS